MMNAPERIRLRYEDGGWIDGGVEGTEYVRADLLAAAGRGEGR
jgi:hypothetical protein